MRLVKWLGAWVVPSNRMGNVIAYLWLCAVQKYGGKRIFVLLLVRRFFSFFPIANCNFFCIRILDFNPPQQTSRDADAAPHARTSQTKGPEVWLLTNYCI